MVYVYKDSKNRYTFSTEPIPELQVTLLLPWDYIPIENIRPWKILGISTDLYKANVLLYLEQWKDSTTPPPSEKLEVIYKTQAEEILSDYKKIIDILVSLELIKEPQYPIKYKKYITYECDILNYLRETLGDYVFDLCEKYKNLGELKKNSLKKLLKIKGRENKLGFLQTLEIDLEFFTFLPPWFKSNYQVFGEQEKTVRNQDTTTIEYREQTRVDGHIGEPLIKENIYTVFSYGEILSSKEIKERLKTLYDRLNIKRTPKVSDLFSYFNVMRTYSRLYRLDRNYGT